MKTFSITALFAAIVISNTAQAHYGESPITPHQQSYGGFGQQTQRQCPMTGYSSNNQQRTGYPGTTYFQNTDSYPKTSYPKINNYPKISYPKNRIGSQQTGGKPWGDAPVRQSGGNPWGEPPVTRQNTGVPQQLQGVWFDISPEGNLWTYVIRANNYDMFEVDPRTNQQVVINGQPVQVDNGPLTFVNGVLHLSPGADVEEGPFNTNATPDASQLILQSLNGDQPRTLTRQRQI